MDLIKILKNNQIFRGLNDEELQEIAKICYEKEFSNGSIIFDEDSSGTGMYILVKGQVDIQMNMGIETELATVHVIKEGEVFGELSLVDKAPRSATTKAAGDSIAFILESEKFENLCRTNAHIGFVVMKNIAEIVSARLRETNIKYTESLIWERLSSDSNE
ncbi:MAG: cyclic nucleotide-binding domain-containing protein [Spirochaetales bacterium]|nr:cyclic nucleotide-binding domain-containing protein [Spirochaetales bacterium]